MTTVLELVTNSLNDLGVIGSEETLSAADASRALKILNNMVQEWNNEELIVYNTEEVIFNYVAGQGDYTLGTGGDFNIDRPIEITAAYNRINNGTSSEVDYPIEVTTDAQVYSDLVTKNIQTSLPILVYDNGNFPTKTLSFWPVPSDTTYRPVLWVWRQISQFVLSDTLSLPPGYETALEWNLAVKCSIPFGKPVPPRLEKEANDSLWAIKRINTNVPTLNTPSELDKMGPVYALPDFLSGR